MARAGGFSLLEAVVAMAIVLSVLASVFAMLNPAHGALAMEPEAADMQQRVRVAVDALGRDLAAAGGGAYIGDHAGPLIEVFPPVLPFRQSAAADDAPETVRADTVTLISVPATVAQTTLAADLLPGALTLQAAPGPACSAGTNLCGFATGMTIAVYDETGSFETFVIAAVFDAAAQMTLTARPAHTAALTYPAGSHVVQARIDIYSLKSDAASQTFQLMHGDGSANADVPAVDHVVALTFDYDALNADGTVTRLSAGQLADGPWSPDTTNGNRWDADLLRVRRVAVMLRVESALAALRGPAGPLFANAGTARAADRWAPDQEVRFQVAPRNLSLGRR